MSSEDCPTLRTFDVFDTVLARRVLSAQEVFLLVGKRISSRGLSGLSPEIFARTRLRAERVLADGGSVREVSLVETYQVLIDLLDLEADVDVLVAIELETERQLIAVVPELRDQIERDRRAGHLVAFLSDCVLPEAFLRSLLEENGLCESQDTCWVSSDRGVSKRRGDMYGSVLASLGVSPGAAEHVGDNAVRDVATPRAMGIGARHYLAALPNRYECALEASGWETGGLSSLLAGASRLARLHVPAATKTEKVVRDVAAGVGAPVLVAYVLWVLLHAQRRELERLYFVARDGEVLLDLARRLAPLIDCTIELRYLHGSRTAWKGPDGVGLAPVAERLLVRYLEQEGLVGGPRSGVVDVGWNGTALDAVAALLGAEGVEAPTGYYLALNRERERLHPAESWLYRSRPAAGEFCLHGMEHLVEAFSTGTHGQTIGYHESGGRIEPTLRGRGSPAATSWHLSLMRETYLSFVDELVLDAELVDLRCDLRRAAISVLRLLKLTPTPEEAMVWGTFPHEPDADSDVVRQLATPLSLGQLARRVAESAGERTGLLWPEAAVQNSPVSIRAVHGVARGAKRLRARAKRGRSSSR